ncbi:hypothetical protein DPMN_122732 [Dreissena polymorpha]|uniref:Uncharacterized protein n=1 Tax=Dreissena polymorpha TaxID=45954 RepID=A0A9D4GT28_DREPO|nr:hypothetical protein DPMN_122732 [Dreissena polymorpha]
MKMEAEEQIILLRQQIVALRKALADQQKEANDVKKQLDKEVCVLYVDKAISINKFSCFFVQQFFSFLGLILFSFELLGFYLRSIESKA